MVLQGPYLAPGGRNFLFPIVSVRWAHTEQLPSDDSSVRVRAMTVGAQLSPLLVPWQETTSSFRLQTSSQGAGLRKRSIFSPAQNLLRLVSKSLGIPARTSSKRECILQRHLLLCFSGVGGGGAHTQLRGQLCKGSSLSPAFKWILGLEPMTLGLHGTCLYSTILPVLKIHSWEQIRKQYGHKVHRIMKSSAPGSGKNRTMASGHCRLTVLSPEGFPI